MPAEITENILIADLVADYPGSVSFLMEKGIKCIACGEPIWGTLASAALEKGYSHEKIPELVAELKEALIERKGEK